MSELFHIEFSQAETVAAALKQDARSLRDVVDHMNQAHGTLLGSGLSGHFVNDLDLRKIRLSVALATCFEECDEAGSDLAHIAAKAREFDHGLAASWAGRRAGRHMAKSALVAAMKRYTTGFGGYAGGGSWGGGAGADGPRLGIREIDLKDSWLRNGRDELINLASMDPAVKHWVNGEIVFWDQELWKAGDSAYSWQGESVVGWTPSVHLLGYDTAANAYVGVDEGKFKIKGSAEFDAYMARFKAESEHAAVQVDYRSIEATRDIFFQAGKDGLEIGQKTHLGYYDARAKGSVQYDAFYASGDAYVGATADLEGGFAFNPFSGDAYLKGEVNAFVGAEASGTAGFDFGWLDIQAQGSVSYGVGARGILSFGVDDGVVFAETGLFASVGVGAGGGVNVRLDVPEMVGTFVEAHHDGLVALAENTIDWLDAVF